MNYEFINAIGLPCPLPVVQAKKALERSDIDFVQIKVDNFTAVQNLEKMAAGLGFGFEFNKVSDSEFDAVLAKHGKIPETKKSDAISQDDSYVVAIGSDSMGRGSDELGKSLMKAFIYSLTELNTLPQTMLFFNSGAFLTSVGSNTIEDLQALADNGTRILTCGACVDFYKLPRPTVGDITNMFEIADIISKAHKLINF